MTDEDEAGARGDAAEDDPASFDSYIQVQSRNLERLRHLPHWVLVEDLHGLYVRSFRALSSAKDVSEWHLHLMVVGDQALISAAATIGRALPGDSIGVTRRAIEAACLAAAIKHDPDNLARWIDEEARLSRWTDRQKGVKPTNKLPGGRVVYPPKHPRVEWLNRHKGMLSDWGVHFTPEFLSPRLPQRDATESGSRIATLRFGYFEISQRSIERAFLELVAVHMQIMSLFDECFDGALQSDAEWTRLHVRISERAKELTQLRIEKGE